MAKNRRSMILKAAESLVRSRRYHEITMDDVAQTAGVGKGTIYRYFSDKEDLFFQLGTEGFDKLCEVLSQPAKDDESFPVRLTSMCQAISDFFVKRHSLMRVIHEEESRHHDHRKKMHERWHEKRRAVYDGIRAILQEGADAELIRTDIDLNNQAALLLGMLRQRDMMAKHRPEQAFEMKDLIELFLNGVAKGDRL